MSGAGESRRKNRLALYFAGFFVMTLGIAISVKSDLGVSPVSSIPYTITCVFGIEMGKATILFHIGLVILQILVLRKAFQAKNLLQIVVGVIFGYFTTFCNYLMTFLNKIAKGSGSGFHCCHLFRKRISKCIATQGNYNTFSFIHDKNLLKIAVFFKK